MKSILLAALLLLALFALPGCASTAGQLQNLGPSRQVSFVADENYQEVYRKILDQARKCYHSDTVLVLFGVQGDLYPDTNSGTITTTARDGRGSSLRRVVDVGAVDEQHARVTSYIIWGLVAEWDQTLKAWGQILQEWVLENSKECSPRPK